MLCGDTEGKAGDKSLGGLAEVCVHKKANTRPLSTTLLLIDNLSFPGQVYSKYKRQDHCKKWCYPNGVTAEQQGNGKNQSGLYNNTSGYGNNIGLCCPYGKNMSAV